MTPHLQGMQPEMDFQQDSQKATVKQMGLILCTHGPWSMRCCVHFDPLMGWHACTAQHEVQHLPLLAAQHQRNMAGHAIAKAGYDCNNNAPSGDAAGDGLAAGLSEGEGDAEVLDPAHMHS